MLNLSGIKEYCYIPQYFLQFCLENLCSLTKFDSISHFYFWKLLPGKIHANPFNRFEHVSYLVWKPKRHLFFSHILISKCQNLIHLLYLPGASWVPRTGYYLLSLSFTSTARAVTKNIKIFECNLYLKQMSYPLSPTMKKYLWPLLVKW